MYSGWICLESYVKALQALSVDLVLHKPKIFIYFHISHCNFTTLIEQC